jgi:hypothetical protein
VALDGYIGTSDRFVEAIADFAVDYADQTEQDYKTFLHSRFAPPSLQSKPLKAVVKHTKKKRAVRKAAPRT